MQKHYGQLGTEERVTLILKRLQGYRLRATTGVLSRPASPLSWEQQGNAEYSRKEVDTENCRARECRHLARRRRKLSAGSELLQVVMQMLIKGCPPHKQIVAR